MEILLKRIFSYVVDYALCAIIIFIVSLSYVKLSIISVNPDYPFLIIIIVFMPTLFFYNLFMFPHAYGNINWLALVIPTQLIIETIVLTMQEFSSSGYTLGRIIFRIKIIGNYDFFRILTRNFLKSISKYFLYIPFFIAVLNRNKQSLYDIITRITVISIS